MFHLDMFQAQFILGGKVKIGNTSESTHTPLFEMLVLTALLVWVWEFQNKTVHHDAQ